MKVACSFLFSGAEALLPSCVDSWQQNFARLFEAMGEESKVTWALIHQDVLSETSENCIGGNRITFATTQSPIDQTSAASYLAGA